MGDPKEKQIRQYYIEQGYEGQALDDAVNYAIEYQAKQTKQTEPKKQTVEPPVAKGGNNQISNIKVNPENKDEAFVEFSAPAIKPPPELVNKDLPDIKERELFYTKGLQQKGFKGEDLQKRLDFALNRDRDRYNKKLEAYEKQVKDSQPKPVVNKNKGGWGDETDDWAITSLAKNAWNNAIIPLVNNLYSIPEIATNFVKTGYNLQNEITKAAVESGRDSAGIRAMTMVNKAVDSVIPYIKPGTDLWEDTVEKIGRGWNEMMTPLTKHMEFDINPAAMNPILKPSKGYTDETFSLLDLKSWEVDSFGKWAGSVGQGIGSTGSIMTAAGLAKLAAGGKVAPALAAFMAGSLTETNGIMQNLMENHDMSREQAMAIAGFAGPIIGTVDVLFGIENIAAKGFFREIVEDEILKTLKGYAGKKLVASQFQEIGKAIGRGVTKRITPKLLNSAAQMTVESVTEGAQSGIEKGIYQLVDNYIGYEKKTGEKLFDKVMSGDSLTGFELNAKAYVDMINEAAIGGIASGPFTAIHMAITPSEQQTLFNYIESQVRSGKDPRSRLAGLIDDQRAGLDEQEKAYARDNVQEMYNVAEAFKGVKGTADGKFQMYSLAKEKIHLQNKINEFQAREQELAGRISELEELTNNPPVPPTMEDVATYQAQNAAAVAELAQRQAEYEQHISKADDVKQYSENIALIDDTAKKVAKAGTVDITYETNKKALEEKYKKAGSEPPADSAAAPAEEKVKKKSKPAWEDGRKEGYMRSRMADLTDENGKRKAHIKDDDGDWFAVIRKPGTIGGLGYDLVEDAPTIKALNDIFGEETVAPAETPVTVETEPIVTPPPAGTEETPVVPTVEPIVTPAPAKPKTKYSKLKDVVLAEGETHVITFLDEGGESTDKSITVKQKLGNQYRVEDESGKEFLVQANDLQNDIFEQDQSGVSADFGAKYTPTKPKPAQGKKEETKPKEETPAPKEETKAPVAEEPKPTAEPTEEEKIRAKIADKKARLKKLNDERNTLKIADDPKRNAEMDIEMLSVATEMIGDYIELGKIKFKDIVNDIIAEDGRTFAEQLFNYIKKAYAAYYTSATDDIADQMDDPKSVRGSKFEDFAEITEPDVVDKAEPIKEQPKQVNTNSGIEKVLNKLRGKVDEQVGNAKTTLSEFEAKALEQEISKLEEKAVSEGGASFNEAEPQNFNYEKIDGKEQKINVYEADGYKIEYGYSRQGWISITTPSGEVLRIIDKKYKNERGRDVVYYAQLKDETRPKTEKPKTVKSAIPTVGEKNEDGEYAYNAPFHEAVDNNTGDVIVGTKEYNMPLADGDTIQYTHVVADAALILPSHDPSGHVGIGATGTGENGNLNVASLDPTKGYPARDGKSANSREYNTKSVIEAMFEHAYDLISEYLLGSPTSSNGEPVITDDGVVISGNSRTMSLWVAIERNKDKKTKVKIKGALRGVDGNYDRYLAALKEEIAGSPAKYAGITVEQIDDMVARGKHPILVKKSSNIKEYSKTEFDRYNQDLTQSKTEEERAKTAKDAIDSATPEQKQQLADLFYMVDDNGITSSIKDILSSKNRAQKIADLLSGMGLLSKADYAKYLHNGIFNNAGIEHVASVLRGIVLSDETLEIFLDSTVNDEFGLKHFVKNIERALPALLYNYLIEGDANVVDWLIAAVQLKTYHYNQGKTDDGYLSVPKKRGVEQKDNIDGFIDMRIRETQTFPTGDANDVFFGLMENEANRLFVTAFFAAANAATRAFASTDLTKLVQAFNNEHRRSVGEKILEETANIFSDTNEDIVRKDALNAIETLVATYYPQLLLSKIADPNISEQEKAELQKQADIHNKKIIANIYDNLIKQGLSIAALEKFARDTFGGKSSSGTTEPIGTKEQKDSKGQETTDTGNAGDTDAGTNQSGSESENKSTENDQATGNQGREPKSGVGVGETEVAGTDSTEQTDTNAETGATENQEKPAEIDEQTTPPTHRVSEEKAVADNKKARAYNGDTLNGVLYSFEEEMRVAAASNEAVKKEKLKAKTSLGVVEISYDKTKDRLAYKKEDGTPLTPNEIETLFVEIVQGKAALTDDSGTTVFAPKETVSNNEAQAQYRAEVRDALKKDKGVSKDIADDTISVESVYKMADQAGVMPADLHKNIKQAILDKTGYTAETYSEILKKPTDGQEKKTDSSKQELRDESKPSSGGAVRGNPSRRVHSERPPIVYAAPNQIPAPEEQIKDNEYTYLDEHQRFGVNLILTRFFNKARGFFLADGPGVGKTAILLAVAHVMSKKGKVLIVTQSKDIINDSFKDDAIGLGIDPKKSGITITTYNDIKTLDEGGNMKFSNTEFVLVIYDESHKLKNSHTGNAIASFNIKSDHILFSSATPMDKPTGAVYFMSQILGLSEEDIYNRLGLQVSTYRDKDGVSKKKVTLLKGTSPQQVAKRLQGLALTAIREGAMLRREFPFWGTIEEVALIPDNIAEILAEEAEIKSYWEGRPRTAGQMLNELRRWNESKKVEAIWQLVMEELAAGRKVVVFANFYTQSLIKGLGKEVPMFITLFTEKAEKMGIPIAKLWSAHDVTIEREKFQNGEVSIALGTFGSAATGVQADDRFGNEPRTLILVTPPYAGDLMQQAIGRVSRKLSQSAAKAIVVYVPGTSDSHAMGIMKKKIMTLEAMQKAGAELEALSVADDFLSEVEGTEPEAGSTELVKDAAKINDLNTKQLDEDNFLVYGTGTYHNRHAIKALGGRFNGNHKGWIFPLSQRAQIERELGIKEEAKFQIAPERGRSYSPVSGSGRGKESDVEAMAKRKAKEGETVAAMKPEEREKYMVKRKAKVLKMAAFLNKVFPKIKLRIVSKAEFYAKFKAEIDAGRVKLDNIAGVKLGDEVWLNIDAMVTNELTAVHEFAHVFTAIMKEYMNKTYMKGLALVAGTVYHQYALATHSGVYKTPEDYLEEALVLAIEDMGGQILSRTLYIRFVDWARSILNRIGRRVGFVKGLSLADMSLNDFTRLIAERMLSGSEISLKEDVSDEIYAQMQIFGEPIEAPDIVAKRGGGILSNPRFSYIGAANIFSNKSKEVIKNAYKMALSMMANGKTSEEIRVATGWFRNPYDKKWRYEIGDREMSFKNDEESLLKISQATEANPLKLSDVINHDKLFALFPELKDIYIIYKQGDTNYHASMRSDGNRITVALPFFSVTTGQQLAILLHEVQHSIQIREGLAMGASPEQMTDILANMVSARAKALQPLLRHTEYPLAFVRIGEYYNALKEILGNKEAEAIFEKTYRTTVQAEINSIEDKINGYDSAGIVDYQGRSAREYLGKKGQFYSVETRRAVNNRLKYADVFMDNENLNRKYRLVSTGAPLSSIRDMYYMATAGEIEARDVEARMFMTDEQRQDTPPYSTEDYQSDEAITYFGTDEDADFAEELVGFRPQIIPTEIKAQAIANGTFMKAPNGKPTNLNERQWLQVRTPEFKAWFGDWESDPKNASKVVDANGEPLVVYHGTSETFNEFNTKRGSSGLGGIYFTPKKEKTAIHGENVMSVFLNLRNPLDISKKSMFLPFEGQIEIDKKNGNDGYVNIRPHEEEYIAFEPNQIKSATDNTGTFSPDTNDIRFSITPTTTPAGTSTARFSIPNGVEISEYLGQQERNAYHGTLSTMNHASIIAQMRTDLDDYVQAYITNNIGSATKMAMLANFYDDPIMLEVAQTITDPFFTPSKEAADLYKFIFDSDPDTPSQNLFGAINKYRLEENYSFLGVHEKISHAADVTDVANQQQALNNAKSGVTKFILNRRKFLIAGQKFGKYLQQQMIDLFNFTTVSKWFSTATGTLAKFDQLIKDRNLIAGKLKARNNQLFELAVNEFSHMTAYRGVNNYTSVKKIEVLNARDGKLYKMPVDYVISLIQMHESFVDHWARQGKNKVSPLIDSTSSGETDGFVFQDFDDPTIQRILRVDDAEYLRLQDEINNTPEYSAMYNRVETLFNRNDIFDYLSQTYSHNTGLKLPRVAKYFPLTAITDTNAEMDLRNITGLLEETSIIKPRTGPARQYRLMGAMSAMKAHYETVEDFVQNQEVILNISNYLNKNEKVLKADKYNQPELIEYLTNFMKDLNNWRRQVYEQNKDQQKVINIPKMLSKFALSRFAWNFGMPLIQAFGYFPALMQGVVKDKYLLLAGKDLSYLITRAYTDSLLLAGEKEKLPILPLSTGEAKLMDEIRHNVFASELYLRLHQTNPDVDLTPLTEINPRSASTIAGAAMQSWNWLINTVADKYGMSFMRRGDRAPILTFYKAAQYQFDAESVGGMLDGMNRDKWVADKATKLMYLTNQLYPMNQRTGFQRRKDILSKMVGLFSGQQQKQLNLALQSYADYLVTPTTENKWRLTGAIGFGIIFSAFGTAFVHALFKGLRDSIKPGDDDDDDEKQGEMLFDYFRTDLIRNLTGNVPGIPTELFNTLITYIDKQYWTDKPADIPPLSSLTELMEGLGEMHNGMTMDADGSIKSEYEQAKSIHRGLVMINRNAAQLLGIPFEFARQFENTVLYSIKPEKPKAKSKKAF